MNIKFRGGLLGLKDLLVLLKLLLVVMVSTVGEGVGSSFSQVILIGSSSVEVPVAPEVGAAAVTLSAETIQSHILRYPRGIAMLTRWRSRVASRSSSPTISTPEIPAAPILPTSFVVVAPSSEFPLAPIVAPLRIRRQRAILIRPGEDIPVGRIYRTHPNGPCRIFIARKFVRPLHSHRLALRYTSHHLDHFTSGSLLGHSSSDHLSSGHSILGHSLYGHTPPDTTVTDSSTPLTTSKSSARDSSFESSTGPSRKRCRSPAATVTSSIHAKRALVPSRADLLPPRKRFRDIISPKDIVKKDIDTDVLEDIEADATAVKVAVDKDVVAGVDAGIDMEVDAGVDVEDEVESSDRGTMEFAPILGYGDLVQGNSTINRVYYIKGLNHNLFSVGQFCEADLERFGILLIVHRSGLVYCSGSLSGSRLFWRFVRSYAVLVVCLIRQRKYTVLAVCQVVRCASGLSY
nr:integrase, catalytic region, zinc finger, CCHC-type, peptidase aspartic, catalytic [Tanacetum cinerariifolium]